MPEICGNFAKLDDWIKGIRVGVTKAKVVPGSGASPVLPMTLGAARCLFFQANNKDKYAEALLPATDLTLALTGQERTGCGACS